MTILLDMDGVLCDYYGAVCRLLGRDPWPYTCEPNKWNWFSQWGMTDADVAPLMDHGFYANLDWTPDGQRIVELAEQRVGADNVYLLTSPWETPGCRDGKAEWIRRNLPGYERRSMIGTPKHLCSRPDAVLIDDSESNCRKFASVKNHPGVAVVLPRPWNPRYDECCFATGRVLDLDGLFHGYGDGRPSGLDEYLAGKR